MTRKERVHDLGNDGVLVPYYAWKEWLTRFESREQIAPDLVPDGSTAKRRFCPTTIFQFT